MISLVGEIARCSLFARAPLVSSVVTPKRGEYVTVSERRSEQLLVRSRPYVNFVAGELVNHSSRATLMGSPFSWEIFHKQFRCSGRRDTGNPLARALAVANLRAHTANG
jgi:hypothetical protein